MPPDSNHSRQPTFWTRLGAGWVSGAVGELVWGHPFSTAMVHLENPEARRLLASHRSLFQSLSGLLFKSNDRRPPTASELARTGRLLIRQQGLEGLWRGASLPVVAGSLARARPLRRTARRARRCSRVASGSARGAARRSPARRRASRPRSRRPGRLLTLRTQLRPPPVETLAQKHAWGWSTTAAQRLAVVLHGRPLLSVSEAVRRGSWRALWALSVPTALRELAFYLPYYVTFEECHGALERTLLPVVPEFAAVPSRVLAVFVGGAAAGAAGTIAAHPLAVLVSARHAELERMLRMTQHAPLSTAEILRGLAVGQRPLGVGLQMLRADSLNAGVEFLRGIAVGKLWHGLGLELRAARSTPAFRRVPGGARTGRAMKKKKK